MIQRLVLIDAHAIIHRAYHALPVLTNRSGQQTNAVYGFVSMLLKIVGTLKPTHLIACFDLPGPTFRHETYIAYQAQRPEADDNLKNQFQMVRQVVEAAGIPIYQHEGFEADDVIGTLVKQAVKIQKSKIKNQNDKLKLKISEVVIVTGDKDMMQLVDKKTKVYMPIKGLSEAKLFGEKEVEEYLGVKPRQIVDYKALVGDTSDNYPGVAGIGPKTAVALLKEYGNLENIYKAISDKKKAISFSKIILEKLREGKEAGELSQDLARIRCDAGVRIDLKRAKLKDLKTNEKFIAKLGQLGFRSLVKRVVGEKEKSNNSKKNSGQTALI